VIVSRISSDSIDRFITEGETFGLVKLVMTENEVIVGADAIGAHAGEWIQFFTLAIRQGLSLQQVSETIFIYPTFSEIAKKAVSRYLRAKQSPAAANSL
jgi:pyruvate/2-oxoglutarate dehydrogenase complex dihydrolipoamide dehydrogenase (E3) component